jgi:DNA-binding GntR family transcriptional regulator
MKAPSGPVQKLSPPRPVAHSRANGIGQERNGEGKSGRVIKASSLASQVYEELRRRITEGDLGEEQPLNIASLVRELGVSQTPVREALARLHAEGLAAFVENVGYRVASRPTEADYQNWMQARLILEVNAIRLAVELVANAQIEELQAINTEIATSDFGVSFDGIRRFSELNAAFHRKLIQITGNPFLIKAYDQIWLGAQFSRTHMNRGVTDQLQIAHEHQSVIEALTARDADQACAAMQGHIVDSLARDRNRKAEQTDNPPST